MKFTITIKLLCIILLLSNFLYAQSFAIDINGDTINKIDKNGNIYGIWLNRYNNSKKNISIKSIFDNNLKYSQENYNEKGDLTYKFEIDPDTIKKGEIIIDGALHDYVDKQNEINFLLIKIKNLSTNQEITQINKYKNRYVFTVKTGYDYEIEFYSIGYLPVNFIIHAKEVSKTKKYSFPDIGIFFDIPFLKYFSLETINKADELLVLSLIYEMPFMELFNVNNDWNIKFSQLDFKNDFKQKNENERNDLIKKLMKKIENRNEELISRLIDNQKTISNLENEKLIKFNELQKKEFEINKNKIELELLAKDKAVSDLTIKAREAELLKSNLLANKKKKEVESLNQQKLINELSIKNKENEIAKKNIEAQNKQKQIQGLKKEKELSLENLKQQKFIQKITFIGSLVLLLFLLYVFYNLFKSKQKNKLIQKQKQEVENQKHIVEEKQKEILDSIHYAKRLQEAILPPLKFIDEHVPNNFVLYQPKDVVAGDFYWAETKDNKFFIAAADCTGHGVPGAMVSVVCSNALNRTVNEFGITDTGKILEKTRELVLETFAKGNAEVKDGMDISLLCIDHNYPKLKKQKQSSYL